MTFDDFFKTATGNAPYAYQRRLACGEPSQISNTESAIRAAAPCTSRLISILIRQGLLQPERLQRLNKVAISQMRTLLADNNVKRLGPHPARRAGIKP